MNGAHAYECLRKMNKDNFMLAPWHKDKTEGLYCCTEKGYDYSLNSESSLQPVRPIFPILAVLGMLVLNTPWALCSPQSDSSGRMKWQD